MTDIFLSYSRKDSAVAETLTESLKQRGWTVWWDPDVRPGEIFEDVIAEALDEARCVIVLWSTWSVKSDFVRAEARHARANGKILPIAIEAVKLPFRFDHLHTLQLVDWDGSQEAPEYQAVADEITAILGGSRVPEPPCETGDETEPDVDYDRTHPFENAGSNDVDLLSVPGSPGAFSSFQPGKESAFLRVHYPTTSGIVDGKSVTNRIFTVEDPIRPYTIQIGETRSLRRKGSPDVMPELENMGADKFRSMYPTVIGSEWLWWRMALAELTDDEGILSLLAKDDHPSVRKLAANNPYAPLELQQQECLFCKPSFLEKRSVPGLATSSTIIIRNDFPYGPYFHYIAMPSDPVHSWEEVDERQLADMNLTIWRFLRSEQEANRLHAPGVHVGLNSTIRHLVLGRRTRATAGASIAHVHKQFWGMSPSSFNLGDHLASVITGFYELSPSVDFLGEYLSALDAADLIVWENDYVVLYVPAGQISLDEMHIMVKRESHSFVDLTEDEVRALSEAEYRVTQIYSRIGISSFNEVLITEKFGARTPGFRLILTFITREIDLAVSELNNLFVVDSYPNDTRQKTRYLGYER
jgi:hypothetical protein